LAKSVSRTLRDPDGGAWVVTEVQIPYDDETDGASLVFASEYAVRRVRRYPPNWLGLSDDELLALSHCR
jgi:hypothetical protein